MDLREVDYGERRVLVWFEVEIWRRGGIELGRVDGERE